MKIVLVFLCIGMLLMSHKEWNYTNLESQSNAHEIKSDKSELLTNTYWSLDPFSLVQLRDTVQNHTIKFHKEIDANAVLKSNSLLGGVYFGENNYYKDLTPHCGVTTNTFDGHWYLNEDTINIVLNSGIIRQWEIVKLDRKHLIIRD